jgi:hypothetical protein
MSSDPKKITITKVEDKPQVATVPTISEPVLDVQKPEDVQDAGKKHHRTFPKGILRKTNKKKIVPTRDPTLVASRKKTLRVLTGTGHKKMRSTLHRKVKRLDDKTIRQKLVDKKLISESSKATPALLRKMYEEATGAGLMKL